MKYLVAVSGGVDSVVLLDMLVKDCGANNLVVAHFDHGIRDSSANDANFTKSLAEKYGCVFELGYGNLGKNTSEAKARQARYDFLNSLAEKYDLGIVVAHHLDDLVETVALNLIRGTGWRGLTPFGQDIYRPMLGMTKADVLLYAHENGLEWVEDETNSSDIYARNRIRPKVASLDLDIKLQIYALYSQQWGVRREVSGELDRMSLKSPYSRYFFIMLPDEVRIEALRFITKGRLTRPQLNSLALAIGTARPGSTYQAGSGLEAVFTSKTFSL